MIRRSRLFGAKTRVTFSLAAEPEGAVSVVGTFNDWTPGCHQLVPRRDGTRSVSVTLPAGEHRFRYLATGGGGVGDPTPHGGGGAGGIIPGGAPGVKTGGGGGPPRPGFPPGGAGAP